MLNQEEWKWRGFPGHFILADKCKFFLHTEVGKYRISTIGYLIDSHNENKPIEVGIGRLYETYVFPNDENEMSFDEIEGKGYNDYSDAENGHIQLCMKYAELQ